jgi:aminoglycoside phosphotransferase (APT) family kinase protein
MDWIADFKIEENLALQLIREQFPTLEIHSFEAYGHGWDNIAFIVNNTDIFRFPRREISLAGSATELRLLKNLSRHLSLPIPVPLYIGTPTEQFPHPYWGYRKLPGTTACHQKLSRQERIALAIPIATFLKELHCIQEPDILSLLKPDPFDRFNLKIRIEKNLSLISQLQALGLEEDWVTIENYFKNIDETLEDRDKTIVHGDLYARHFLLDDRNCLAGVIDWGDVHYGSPAIDLEILFDFLPKESRAIFIQAYGPVKKEALALAQFRSISHTLTLLQYAHLIHDAVLFDECRVGIKYIIESILND